MTIADCMSGKGSGLITFPTDLITPPGIQTVGPGVSFLPSSLPGLQLWLDFSDLNTLFIDSLGTIPVAFNGDLIGHAKDKSGNGNNAIQDTTALKFTWTLPGWSALGVGTADGGDRLRTAAFASALSQPTTIFLVARHTGDFTGTRTFYDGIAVGNRHLLGHLITSGVLYINAGAYLYSTNATSGVPLIFSVVYNGVSSNLFLNGVSIKSGDAGAQTLTGLTLAQTYGNGSPLTGNYAELLVYNPSPSAANQALIESYLNTKWTVY